MLMLPLYLWLSTDLEIFREPWVVAPWVALVAFLMISSMATFSWSAARVRRGVRLGVLAGIAILVGALISAPWPTLSLITIAYVAAIPFSVRSYVRVKRLRASQSASPATPSSESA
jgi:CDP-diacylglycerol--serine O-phosphatidyltransferase